jgi:glycosyltransferase involved in cell wall biosynthesis
MAPASPEALPDLSVVIPALNEGAAISRVLVELLEVLERLPLRAEVIVVDDGSRDDTAAQAQAVPGVRVVRNPVNLGYGHSLLRGIAAARGELLAITDADGTYPVRCLPELYAMIEQGADHAIGQRTGAPLRRFGWMRTVYRLLCRYVVGQTVPDANSGLRVFRREIVRRLRGDLCLGFSFTTSLTLASIMSGYVVTFTPIPYGERVGRSHVRWRDVLRTAQYLFQLIAVYNPLKLFLPLVLAAFAMVPVCFGYGIARESFGAMISGVILTATSLVLVGLAGTAYIISRVGMSAPLLQAPPPAAPPAHPLEPAASDDRPAEPAEAAAAS